MTTPKSISVATFLANLPADRRSVVEGLRRVIRQHLPQGYVEGVNWNMLMYEIPLARYPHTYNGQPLGYVGVAAQKNYFALYLLGVYQEEGQAALAQAFAKAGKKLDMGRSCIRFRDLDDLPLDVIARTVASVTPEAYIARYEAARAKPPVSRASIARTKGPARAETTRRRASTAVAKRSATRAAAPVARTTRTTKKR